MQAQVKEWRARWWGVGAFVLAAALMALVGSVVYGHDSTVVRNLRATRLAVVTAVNDSIYTYTYETCKGNGSRYPPPTVGSQVRIFYDPSAPCENLAYDPAPQERSDLMWLLVFSVVFSPVVGSAVWDATRQA